MHWIECQRLIDQRIAIEQIYNLCRQGSQDRDNLETLYKRNLKKLKHYRYRERIRRNSLYPMELVLAYEQRINCYFDVLVKDRKNGCGVFGNVSNYYSEMENHKRGYFHNHSLTKLQSVPNGEDALEMWNKIISANVPNIQENDPRLADDFIPSEQYLDEHPCSFRFDFNNATTEEDVMNDLRDVVAATQIHRHAYYLSF
jgi:hypothetical protein